ncbi:MAG: ACT domain-containing protein [Actinomycetota bacterium]|nr:ACT domain-containing protein [Actinomycetota bacterium]
MSYLLRVVLPDRPGTLGAVATALGEVGADILSLDVVERSAGRAVDDLLVALPPGGLADTLITSAQSVPGVVVDSLRPYAGSSDLHRDLELLDELAAAPGDAAAVLARCLPSAFRAGWALVAQVPRREAGPELVAVAASPGAPPTDGLVLPWLPLDTPRALDDDDEDLPEEWRRLATQVAAVPLGPDQVVLVARPGGPSFRRSELLRLAHLAAIAATVAGDTLTSSRRTGAGGGDSG